MSVSAAGHRTRREDPRGMSAVVSSRAETPGPPEGGSGGAPGDGASTDTGPADGTPEDGPRTDGAPANGTADGAATAADGGGATRIPQSALRRRVVRRRVLRGLAVTTALVVVGSAGAAWFAYRNLDDNIRTDSNTARMLGDYESERPEDLATEATNILLIGSDDRSGANSRYGGESGTRRSDTTILLHLSADRRNATAVSIPRDLMAQIPSCRKEDGSETRAQFAQFNWAFQFGGPACAIRTVEKMTGVRIDHHLIVDFTGFKKMVDAVGGVEVCLPEPARDEDAKLDLPAGRQTVRGEDALAYVRARHSFGDGSDTQRMSRQQQFLASLVKQVKSSGVLLNPAKLYPLLDAATSSLTADAGLDSLGELYGLARGLEKTPDDGIGFLTVPREQYVNDRNRDQLVQPAAEELFTALREDRPVKVAERDEAGSAGTGATTDPGGAGERGGLSHDGASRTPSAEPEGTLSSSVPSAPYQGTTPNHDICGSS